MTSRQEQLLGSLRIENGHASLSVAGEIDLQTLGRFRALLEAAVAVEPRLVVLDLGGLGFMGMCALPVLESSGSALRHSHRRLLVRDAPPAVQRLLEAAGMSEVLEIESSEETVAARRRANPASTPDAGGVRDAALQVLVAVTATVVAGADGASITLPRQERRELLGTVAASDDVVLQMDRDQYATGEGPCLDAATMGRRVCVRSLHEKRRWPAFAPRARARGIEAILSTPLLEGRRTIGALNIYSRNGRAFGPVEQGLADRLAEHAATIVRAATATA